jgi:hypothetical protein
VTALPDESAALIARSDSSDADKTGNGELAKRIDQSGLIPNIDRMDEDSQFDHQLQLHSHITMANAWMNHRGFDTTAQWYDILPVPLWAVGLKGLFGCTSIVIVTSSGIFISHIYEGPVFVNADRTDTDDDHFEAHSFNLLRDGGDGVDVRSSLSFLKSNGYFDTIHSPHVFVITPFKLKDEPNLEYQYLKRAQWLGDQTADYIYAGQETRKPPVLRGYVRTDDETASSDRELYGRLMVEVAPANGVLWSAQGGGLVIARWRLWVGGLYVTDWDFTFGARVDNHGNGRQEAPSVQSRRQSDDFFEQMCPGFWDSVGPTTPESSLPGTTFVTATRSSSESETSPSPSSIITSTTDDPAGLQANMTLSASTPSTEHDDPSQTNSTTSPLFPPAEHTSLDQSSPITTHSAHETAINPPGQPPGFTLPTPTKVTSETSVPEPEIAIGEQRCWKQDLFEHKQVYDGVVNDLAELCIRDLITEDQISMGPDDKPLSWQNGIPSVTVGYAEITWVDGCVGPDQNPMYPADGLTCRNILFGNWEACQSANGGAGGYRVVGCLRYMFMPQLPSVWYPEWN